MKYRTGKLPPGHHEAIPRLMSIMPDLPAPPPAADNLARVRTALALPAIEPIKHLYPMDGNDRFGCCTWAAAAHMLTTAAGMLGRRDVPAEAWVVSNYRRMTQGFDTGLVLIDVLRDLVAQKLILGFARIPVHDERIVRSAIATFGGVIAGVNLQSGADEQFDQGVWRAGALSGNGHAIWVPNYRPSGLLVSTWGGFVLDPWDCWAACGDEAFVALPIEAREPGFCPGLDVEALTNRMTALGAAA